MKPNLLIDVLPNTIEVEGRAFFINSDFRTGILFELLIDDKTLTDKQKIIQIFDLYFANELPNDKNAAIEGILNFYRCGAEAKKQKKPSDKKRVKEMIYHFDYDDALIYAAFKDQYSIDLNDITQLHWWKFQALFRGLKSDNEIVKIMEYRSTDLSKIKNKTEKERIARLKAIHALPSNLTVDEKAAVAGSIFGGGLK